MLILCNSTAFLDFTPLSVNLTFQSSTTCVTVAITNDIILEDTERFSIFLKTMNPDVAVMGMGVSPVVIIDNDGMHILYLE